jgi:predicted amidohydrolase YtcJ
MGAAADLILDNAVIYTADAVRSRATALAVRDGIIVAVGGALEVDAWRGPVTRTIDMRGRHVLPGIVDVHNHHLRGGQADLYELTIRPSLSRDEVVAAVRRKAAETPRGEWIFGGIWGSHLIGGLYDRVARESLDAAAPDHPVMLRDDSQHNRWLNSRALALVGIGHNTPDPPDGTIVRDPATGDAVGLLLERACGMAEQAVAQSIPDLSQRNINSSRRAVEILNGYGVTAFQDATTVLPFLKALTRLDARGELTAWCVASMPAQDTLTGAGVVGEALFALRAQYRSRHVRPDFVKLFMDGVPTTRTAAMLTPYISSKMHGCGFCGDGLISKGELARWIARAEQLGLGVKVHCTGDAAVRDTLDAVEMVRTVNGPGRLHHIAHASFIDPADIPRFRALNVAADLSPIIWYPGPIMDAIRAVVPKERADRYWPNRDLHEAGALLAAGSDWPVISNPDPWLGIEGMLTRRDPSGRFDGALWPEQALDLETVLGIYTINAARAMGLGDVTGSLEPGKSADFIVIDRDLFAAAPEDVADTKVLSTWFEGRCVYERA